MRRFQSIVGFVKKNPLLIVIILCAAFIRLYRIGGYAMFLADQGRDAIIIKRIVTLEHLPAIGPPSSIGQVYLGPFFYYLMAPFLFIFRLQPVGLAVGEAVISLTGLLISYFIVRKLINPRTALVFLMFAAFSSELVRSSRFSWNPNPLPYFAFIMVYFLHQAVTTRKALSSLLFGIFFALCFQLHHLAAFMALPILLTYFLALLKDKKVVPLALSALTAFGGFLLVSAPLIIFDLKHDFINTKNLISLFTRQNLVAGGSPMDRLLDTNRMFITYTSQVPFSPVIAFLIAFAVVGTALFFIFREKKAFLFIAAHLLNAVFFVYLFSLLSSPRYPHYYGVAYLSFFVLVAYILVRIAGKRFIPALYLIVIGFLFLNVPKYDFLAGAPGNQMRHAERVASSILPYIGNKPFNFATYPIEFTSEEAYLYYLEKDGHAAADRAAHEVTDQMYVLCDRGACDVLHTKSWNIDMFGPAKIDTMWEVEGIRIFRLVHPKQI